MKLILSPLLSVNAFTDQSLFFVYCLSVSIKTPNTQVHLTINALNMGLITVRIQLHHLKIGRHRRLCFVVISHSTLNPHRGKAH